MFQVFNKFCGKKKSNSCKLEVNDMNKFFATIGPTLSKKLVEFKYNDKISRNSDTFVFFPTDVDERAKVIKNLMNRNSTGHDGLSNVMIKLCAPVIMKLLVVCFNEMFDSESFPNDCKIAKVIALFKSGSEIDFGNYRIISILSTISKIFEKLIYRRMVKFLQKYKILCPEQFGFRKKNIPVYRQSHVLSNTCIQFWNKEVVEWHFF